MQNVAGIDFGTTNSVVGGVDSKGIVRPWLYGAPDGALMRSVLTFLPQNGAEEAIIGARAEELSRDSRAVSFSSWKRRLGEEELQTVDVFGKTMNLVDLTAIFLGKLAAPLSGGDKLRAVMTVPANAPELQLQRMRLAAEAARIDVLGLLKEPTAAAVAYGLHRNKDVKDGEIFLVLDIGGGTFDVSIVEYNRAFGFRVITTRGVEKLGGDDWDIALARAKAAEYGTQFEQDCFATDVQGAWINPQAVASLKAAAEWTKIQLSGKNTAVLDAQVVIGSNFVDLTGAIDPQVTRAQFEDLTNNLLERVKEQTLAALNDSDHQFVPESIHHVVLVGGPTRMPALRAMVRKLFGSPVVYDKINPDECVALGAARYAADLAEGKDTQVVQDVVGARISLVHHDSQGNELRRTLFDRNDPLGGSVELPFATKDDKATVRLVQSASDTRNVEKRIATVNFKNIGVKRGKLRAEVTGNGEVNLYVAMADGQRDSGHCKRVETPSDIDLAQVAQAVDEYVFERSNRRHEPTMAGSTFKMGEVSAQLTTLEASLRPKQASERPARRERPPKNKARRHGGKKRQPRGDDE